jgi:tagaturonate reductase
LYRRFKAFFPQKNKGLIIIPCELIDRNGDNLKRIVLQLAEEWSLGSDFIKWLKEENYFLNTLVDRIVTGYPKEEVQSLEEELGYKDGLLDTGEIFHLWVIEGDSRLAAEIPFSKAGLNVIWTDNMKPYRDRKVRILNGAHTMTVLAACLYGLETVKECMDDRLISTYMRKGIFDEIIPTLDLEEDQLIRFAQEVLERFSNPFIKHYLLSISLNSVSKFKARVLPSLLEYLNRKEKLPEILTFSLASLIAFYKGKEIKGNYLSGERNGVEYKICDDMPILEAFCKCWKNFDGTKAGSDAVAQNILSRADWWGSELNEIKGLTNQVSEYLFDINTNGMEAALKKVVMEG